MSKWWNLFLNSEVFDKLIREEVPVKYRSLIHCAGQSMRWWNRKLEKLSFVSICLFFLYVIRFIRDRVLRCNKSTTDNKQVTACASFNHSMDCPITKLWHTIVKWFMKKYIFQKKKKLKGELEVLLQSWWVIFKKESFYRFIVHCTIQHNLNPT